MFKRRTSKTWLLWFWHFLWPNGGWSRRFEYVKYRIKRLPDSPKRISLGIAAGVFASFTPLYGFHFFVAMIIAIVSIVMAVDTVTIQWIIRINITIRAPRRR